MSKVSLAETLKMKYPEMYDSVSCGIYVDEGWHNIVFMLSNIIYNHCKFQIKNGKMESFPKVAQIKEKFGGLRFYMDGGDSFCNGAIHMAEVIAETTCEVCGKEGKLRRGGWIKTLCDVHDKERTQKMESFNQMNLDI